MSKNQNVATIGAPPAIKIQLELNALGAMSIKINTPLSASRLISLFSQAINANAIAMIEQEEMLINPNRKPPVANSLSSIDSAEPGVR